MSKKRIIVIILMILLVIALVVSLTLVHAQKQQLRQAQDVIRDNMYQRVAEIRIQSHLIQELFPETADVSENNRELLWYRTNQLLNAFAGLREQRATMMVYGVTDSKLPGSTPGPDGDGFSQMYNMVNGCGTVWRRYDQLKREDQERFLKFYETLMTKIRMSFDEIPTDSDLKTAVSQVDAQLGALLDQLEAENLYEEDRKLIDDLSLPTEAAPQTVPDDAEAPVADDAPSITFHEINSALYFRLKDLEQVSDITVHEEADGATLEESGLVVSLKADSAFVDRDGRIVAAMKQPPIWLDGAWYASKDYCDALCQDASPSLFRGSLFFAAEVAAALDGTGSEAFNQKLLNEVLLPTSMGVTGPHIDMARVFVTTPLTEYPDALLAEMRRLGVEDPEQLAYSEYSIINGAQSLRSAGLAEYVASRPELKDLDSDETTVAAYETWQRNAALQSFENDLSDEAKTFAEEKGISLSDLSYLTRCFYGNYLEQSDDALREALIRYYRADLQYVLDLAAADSAQECKASVTSADARYPDQYFVAEESVSRLRDIFYGIELKKVPVFPESIACYTVHFTGKDYFSLSSPDETGVCAFVDGKFYVGDLSTENLQTVCAIIAETLPQEP